MFARLHHPLCLLLLVLAAVGHAYDPTVGDFSRRAPTDVRILSYNVERNFISVPVRDAAFARVFRAVDPDIIVFQEILRDDVTDTELRTRLEELLPIAPDTWHLLRGQATNSGAFIQTVVASRWPLSLTRTNTTPAAPSRGVTMALVDLPDAIYATDLYVMGVHLPCCTDEVGRQKAADAMAAWMGNARQPGGLISLAANTPMLVVGDTNMREASGSEFTLLTGDIADEATFGADVAGDWDGSGLLDLTPRDPYTNDRDTWPSGTTAPSNRFDRFVFTDSVMQAPTGFVLNTATMTANQRAGAGLQAGDISPDVTADHLPIVMDARVALRPRNAGLILY